ncbi:MAG: UrcA family protein [Steroidobacteraceae bacterium]
MDHPDDVAPVATSSARDARHRSGNIALPALAALAAFGATWWFARPSSAPPCRVVSYADLDLSKPSDFSTLMARLDEAANAVCAAAFARGAAPPRRRAQCVEQARQRALMDVRGRAEARPGGAEPVRHPGSSPVRVVAPRASEPKHPPAP